jgi:hypothetical protein
VITPVELSVQRKLTAAFVEADPLEIQLNRPIRTPDGAGGYKDSVAPVGGLQRLRLIPLGDGAAERTTADGKSVAPSYMLMGTYLADIQRWDEFTVDGRRYQIVFINQNQQYEVKGEVAYLG